MSSLPRSSTCWALSTSSDVAQSARRFRSVLAEPNVACTRKDVLLHATDLYEHLNLDWVDCYLIASTSITKVTSVLSFDKGIDKIKDVRVEP